MLMIPEIGEIPYFEPRAIPKEKWQDGVIVRSPNWLGDAVMAIPALQMLRSIVPDYCGLFVAAPAGIAPVFRALSIVDYVVPLADAHAFPSRAERSSIRKLFPGFGVLFNNSFRDALAFRMMGIPVLFGAAARYRSLLLERSFQFPPRLDHTLNKPHQAAKYMAIASALGAAPWNGVLPEFRPEIDPEKLPGEIRSAAEPGKAVLAVCAGAAYGGAKRWHEESFREICQRWISKRNGEIVMLGSPKEREAADHIISGLDHCVNLCGKTNLSELIWFLKQCGACLANDSGVMHLAAALGLPGVSPFGPTDPAATSPLSKNWRIVFEKRDCSPCFKRVCPLKDSPKACFDPVTPDAVWSALEEILA